MVLTAEQLQGFRTWQQAGRRTVTIELGDVTDRNKVRVWVYDYDLAEGQFVKDPSEIDLVKIQKEKLQQEIERLQKLQENAS